MRFLSLFCLFGLVSCSEVEKEPIIEVEECVGDADIDDTTLIIWELEESIHEMITCGSLTFQLITALLETGQGLASGESSFPDAFASGDGIYSTNGDGVSMDLQFWYASGEPVPANLFDVNNYLQNATTEQDGNSVIFSFSGVGPLVSLLGKGDNPSSPLVMSEQDFANFSSNLGNLKLSSTIFVDHEKDHSVVQYEIDNPPSALMALIQNLSMDMSKSTATSSRADLNQQLSPTQWDITYVELTKKLDGVIKTNVIGGPFDFQATLEYNGFDMQPDITIECLSK